METTDIGLVAPIKEGKLNYQASTDKLGTETPRGSSKLGKDAFLQLLVCQMQYQDPLEPNTDTEFVSQLAQFSSLEQLQNLGTESQKAQAFSLVGKYVTFKITDKDNKTKYPEGVVESVNMSGTDIKIKVNGTEYNYSDLYRVVDGDYVIKQNSPKINEQYKFVYNAKVPEDVSFNVDFGSSDYKATEVALLIGGQQINNDYIHYKDNTVTVDSEAFSGLENGDYAVSAVFNNSIFTTINDKLTLTVYNAEVQATNPEGDAQSEE